MIYEDFMRYICDNTLIFNAVMAFLGAPTEMYEYMYGFEKRYLTI